MRAKKPYNNGKWSEARMRSFIMSALRKAQWGVKYEAIKKAFVKNGVNPDTGRRCKLHQCAECGGLFPAKEMQADHIEPVVPLDGNWGEGDTWLGYDWNKLIQRLFCEAENFQALCVGCHKLKCAEEKKVRAEFKKKAKGIQELF